MTVRCRILRDCLQARENGVCYHIYFILVAASHIRWWLAVFFFPASSARTSTALASQIINLIEEIRRSSHVCQRLNASSSLLTMCRLSLPYFRYQTKKIRPGEFMRLTAAKICVVSEHVLRCTSCARFRYRLSRRLSSPSIPEFPLASLAVSRCCTCVLTDRGLL